MKYEFPGQLPTPEMFAPSRKDDFSSDFDPY